MPRSMMDEQQFQPWDLLVDDQGNSLVLVDDHHTASPNHPVGRSDQVLLQLKAVSESIS